MGLRLRIFLGLLMVVLLALASTGVVAYYHAKRQDVAYNEQRLQRKEAALSRSLDYVLSRHNGSLSQDSISVVFTDRICELADVHSLVFSLYSLEGGLITTSADFTSKDTQPPILLPKDVLKKISGADARVISRQERDGSEITQVRWVAKDSNDTPVMIASARYKPRQIDADALGDFLSRLAPVYLVLFLGAILIAYFIVQSIARPLIRLKQEMADVNPSMEGLPLEYRWEDEIGGLVTQYNELLEKLRASLEERAKYEREGAWKEMAQQVAHEIKNPLTPLRLGIQQLEKAWLDSAPDFEKRIEKFSSTALAQIDILSRIAEDFALLAEVRKPHLTNVSISDIVANAAGLYGTERIIVEVEKVTVLGDRVSLTRAFNNLISNAIEATEDAGKSTPVIIKSASEGGFQVISVSDCGVGIAEDKLKRIFEPRFTTKKHGLGLGLAMVKSIVEQAKGEVHVYSSEGHGSTFSIKLLNGK